MLFIDDMAVLVSFVFGVAASAVVACVAGGSVAPMLLSDDVVDVAVVAVGADVLGAIITALTAVVLSFKLRMLSRHFFLWVRLPCPGPGMLGMMGAS